MRIGSRIWGAAIGVLAGVAAFAFPAAAAAPVSSMPDRTAVTNGTVQAFARVGDKLYIGGTFSRIGPRTGPWALVDASSGAVRPGLPEVSGGLGRVSATVADGAGGWYVGGNFSRVGGLARSNLAHIRANRSVDPAFPQTNGTVNALAFSAGKLYVGGSFTSIGGVSRNALAAVDTAGNLTTWNPGANGSDPPYVNALVVSGTTLYVGGSFSGIGGESAGNLAALSTSNGGQLWTALVNGIPSALALQGSTLYLGGSFGQIGGLTRYKLGAVSASTGEVQPWSPAVSGDENLDINALVATPTAVYIGGHFLSLGGATRIDIGAVDPVTGTATSWNPGANADVDALALTGSTLLVGGSFSIIGGARRLSVAALSTATGAPSAWAPQSTGEVRTIAASGADVALGGWFSSLGAVERNGLAELDANNGALRPWNPTALGYSDVYALAVRGSTLYVGGYFSSPPAHQNLLAFDTATGAMTTWGAGGSGTVYQLAVSGSTVYVAGWFSQLGSVTRHNLGALDATTGQVLPWNPDANASVGSLVLSGSTAYVAGSFTTIGSDSRNHIAAIRTSDGKATPWNPAPTGGVEALAVAGGTVYAGGTFTAIGGQPRKYLAALSAATGSASAWNPAPDAPVYAVATSGSSVFAGGTFTTIGGKSRPRLAEVEGSTGQATSWAPVPSTYVGDIAADPDGTIYAGGYFHTLDLAAQSGFAAFSVAPANTAAPAIGPAHVGKPVTCTTGTWTGGMPQRYAYAWLVNGAPVDGQTAATFTPTQAAAGMELACRVTATNRRGSAAATSAPVLVPPKPKAVTRRAKRVRATKARLRGLVNPNGETTTYYFLYGRTKRYGHRTRLRSAGAGITGRAVVVLVKRLKPGKTYHFRLVAKSASGVTRGRDITFRTRKLKKR